MDNAITEAKTCQHCRSSFDITQSDLKFYDKISPSFAGHKFQIPAPTLCPECRQCRRLSFRNERKLYRRQCDASQKSIISIYSPDKPYTVYDQSIWWSDSRDAMDYGCEFDFTRTFGENFQALMSSVPKLSLINMDSDNSEYANPGRYMKNCYMVHSVRNCEECYYSTWIDYDHDCIDCYSAKESSNCYMSVGLLKCFACYSCANCTDCSHCINCYDLSGASYCINNKQYSKEEYNVYVQKNGITPDLPFIAKYDRNSQNISNEDCDNCDFINYSKHCNSCYLAVEGENLKYCSFTTGGTCDSMDSSYAMSDAGLLYETLSGVHQSTCITTVSSWDGVRLFYCDSCYGNNRDCFGCVGLRNKQYCIFNRQYTKQEYEIQVAKIISHMQSTGEWGEFFHPSLSPFGYNETVAQEYFPLTSSGGTKDLVGSSTTLSLHSKGQQDINFANFGYSRSTYETPTPQVDKVIKGQDLPDIINDIDDSILKTAIQCETSGKLFRIIPQELIFYRKHNISLPRKHPDVRHMERMALRR